MVLFYLAASVRACPLWGKGLTTTGGAGAVAKHIYVILYFTCATPTTSVVAQTTVITT